ncbi:hypothetical protein GQ53DRAFT_251251 [Thozetella sp. PMI_491]|nr:hypothetical protein GQ53DRAFT_251251 [Thozetella sp. PMI_491]
MDGMEEYGGEFIFDSEENTPSPLPLLPEYDDNAGDALKALDTAAAGQDRGYLSPSLTFATPAVEASPQSANGSHDSLSDSSSSKRTQSTASTKTTFTGGDIMMSDGPESKEGWQFSDFIHGDDETTQDAAFQLADHAFGDDSANLGSLGVNAFTPVHSTIDTKSGFTSATSSPSPFAMTADALSPPVSNGQVPRARKQSPAAARAARGHTKGNSQFSLDQAMGGLNTNGSREVSPFSNMATSHTSSPAAFRASPSPSATFNFGLSGGLSNLMPGLDGSDGAGQWQNSFALSPTSLQQTGMAPAFQMPASMQPAPGPFGYQIPTHIPYMGPGAQRYSLTVHPTPPKSRVETQIPIKLSLSPLPPGIKRLHLPTYTISKPKLLVKPTPEPSPDMLELHTVLVCTSAMQKPELKEKALQRALASAMIPRGGKDPKKDPDKEEDKPIDGGEVHICNGCVLRERKRAARKKVKKPEDEKLWQEDEVRRVIVFNTNEVKEWQQPSSPDQPMGPFQVDAPMRIACYCRHHNEKSGFQVIFTITDYHGNLIAQCLSPSIMITDDHKTHTFPQVQGGPTTSADTPVVPPAQVPSGPLSTGQQPQDLSALGSPEQQFHLSPSSTDLPGGKRTSVAFAPGVISPSPSQPTSAVQTPKNLSRPASPTGHHGPMNKKRKASGGPAKVPSTLTMTRLDTSNIPASQGATNQAATGTSSASPSPFSPALTSFPGQQEPPLFAANPHAPATAVQPFVGGPTTPGNEQPALFPSANRSTSIDHLAMTQMYSAPASTQPSRPTSPAGMRSNPAVNGLPQQSSFAHAQALSASLSPYNIPARPPSVIHKIVPAEGPKSGGVEVTILGGGFFQGLEVMFGSNKATTTTYWGESSLVCLLPPSAVSGLVPVTLMSKQQPSLSPQQYHKQPMFRYIDDDEQQILRTALSIMGHKMTGTFQDAAEIARKIIGDTGSGNWRSSSSGSQAPLNVLALNSGDFETQLLKILELIDLDDSPHKARYNLRRSTGQTMLHLACAMGLNRFVAGLLARGANPDIRDKGGYTPLHMAALNDHVEIVRRLILNGADPTIRTLSGLAASDVSQSREVLKAVKRVERHVRSRSGGSLEHSRANSASSLKSLWGLSQPANDGPDSAEESLEYTSEDMVSEEDDPDADEGVWMGRRRSSVHDISTQEVVPDAHPPLHSPSAAVAAMKEQFAAHLQLLQENFSMRLQNLPQFPYLPQMPMMPPIPDYQAAVMQRLTAMMPNINITRPGSGDQPPSAKEIDGRWWDLSSLMASASAAPPPAYNEIFPQTQRDLDTKQASAARAAADAEADQKCAMMYDRHSSMEVTSSPSCASTASSASSAAAAEESSATTPKLPALLQIGRKNAVTKEQQDNLRRVHAEKLKRLRADRNLFFIWIPLLVIVLTAMLYNRFPSLFSAVGGFIALVFSYLGRITSSSKVTTASAEPLATAAARVVEV